MQKKSCRCLFFIFARWHASQFTKLVSFLTISPLPTNGYSNFQMHSQYQLRGAYCHLANVIEDNQQVVCCAGYVIRRTNSACRLLPNDILSLLDDITISPDKSDCSDIIYWTFLQKSQTASQGRSTRTLQQFDNGYGRVADVSERVMETARPGNVINGVPESSVVETVVF